MTSVGEGVLDALGLRQPVGNATRAEHLERLDNDNLASEIGQSRIFASIEPTGDSQLRSSGVRRLHGQRRLHSRRAPQHDWGCEAGGSMRAKTDMGDKYIGNLRIPLSTSTVANCVPDSNCRDAVYGAVAPAHTPASAAGGAKRTVLLTFRWEVSI